MCILIVKPAGVKVPSMKIFENCFWANKDGAGFAYSDGRKLTLSKGHMKFKDFENALHDSGDLTKYPAIFHFRIATHGTVKPANTHPFNVNDRMVAGHNGILRITPKGDLTDSETFFKYVCAPVLETCPLYSEEFSTMVSALIDSSKLAFLTDKGDIKMFGKFEEEDGVFYSNTSYLGYGAYRGYSAYSTKNYRHWDDDVYGYGSYPSRQKSTDKDKASNQGVGNVITHPSATETKKKEASYPDRESSLYWDVVIVYDDLVNFSNKSHDEAIKAIAEEFDMTMQEVQGVVDSF